VSPTDDQIACFAQYLAHTDGRGRALFALAHPVLFSGDLLQHVQRRAGSLPPAEAAATTAGLTQLAAVRERVLAEPLSYPEGHGPIEKVVARLESGALAFSGALAEVTRPPTPSLLSFVYVLALGARARRDAQTSKRALAVQSQRLVVAAADAMPETGDKVPTGARARMDWIEVAKTSLAAVPDGRVFEAAEEAARWLVDQATRSGDAARLAWAHCGYGTLYLDAYTAGKSTDRYRFELNQWEGRLEDELGRARAAEVRAAHPMPAPEDALRAALDHCRKAAEGVEGRPRAGALRAQVQAMAFLAEGLGVEIDRKALADAGREALRILDPRETGALEIVSTLRLFGVEAPSATPHARAPTPPEGTLDVAHRILAQAQVVADSDARGALTLLRDGAEAFEAADAGLRRMRWARMVTLIGRVEGVPPLGAPARGGMKAFVDALVARARDAQWPEPRVAAALLLVAAHSGQVDEERAGVELLAKAAATFPAFFEENREVFAHVDAALWDGEGANLANADRRLEAIEAYAHATVRMLALRDREGAFKALKGLVDVLSRGGGSLGQDALPHLARLAFLVEQHAGDQAVELLQAAYRAASAALGETVNTELMSGLLELAKGHALATALRGEVRYDPRADAEVRARLAEIGRLERDAGIVADVAEGLNPLQREVLQSSYLAPGAPQPGATPAQQALNLKHTVDQHIGRRVLEASDPRAQHLLADDETRALLDDDTVLIDLFLGRGDRGQSLFLRLLTREETALFQHGLSDEPPDPITLGVAERELRAHPMAPAVAVFRSAILAEPEGGALVSAAAQEALDDLSRAVLGPSLTARLSELRALGKTHLCIVGQGPLHFFPLHLLQVGGECLADAWVVTQLPNLRLLGRDAARGATRREGAAVFGLSFQGANRFGLPPIRRALDEARDVAGALGEVAVPEAEATPSRFLEALRTKRWVHLSTHGSQALDASAFHNLFLTPEGDRDGRLFAYELMAEACGGLEVLTLSACESGLGRVDEGDNLRGLPASLLLAGCRAIVGALWPVEDQAARLFFASFYRALAGGASTRRAFHDAQVALRDERPEHRDWAPFYLIDCAAKPA
jgi:hypothetical protein